MDTLLIAYEKMARELTALDEQWRHTPAAVNAILRKPVYATADYPRFSQSAMDGYVVHASDLSPTEIPMEVSGLIQAGDSEPTPLKPQQPCRIFTGGPIPNGGAAVRIQENVELLESGKIRWNDHISEGANIRYQGSDIRMNQMLLPAGHQVSSADLALLANLQIKEVSVCRKPKIGLMTTGNELVDFEGEPPLFGQVVDGNQVFLSHHLTPISERLISVRLNDDVQTTRHALTETVRELDLLITCGGMSVGAFDVIGQLLRERGETLFYKVAVKPGKPILLSRLGNTIIVGLPGNPISTFVGYYLFVQPVLKLLQGSQRPFPTSTACTLKSPLAAGGSRLEFLRAHVDGDGDVTLSQKQGSAALSGLVHCNSLVIRAPNAVAKSIGETVQVYRFTDPGNECSLSFFRDRVWPSWLSSG